MMRRIAFPLESFDNPTGGGIVALNVIQGINPLKFKPVVLFPKACKVSAELQAVQIAVEFWPLHENHGLLRYIADIARCMIFFKHQQIEILHFNHIGYWKPAEIIAAKLLHIPIITHVIVARTQNSPFLKYCDIVAPTSQFIAKGLDLPAHKIQVIYPGLNLAGIDAGRNIRHEFGIRSDEVIVSFIGALKPEKGIEMFLDAAAALKFAHVRFMVVGASENTLYEAQINARIAQNPRIVNVGYRRDMPNIYHTSDIIIMPSQCEEAFGLINIEAGAARKPIISTNVGGIPEIIRHGVNGFLVAKDDLSALISYTEQLILDADLRRHLGENGRKLVAERFSLSQHLRYIENLYESLII